MEEIEVDSIEDVSIKAVDTHSRVSEDVEPLRHNLETIKTDRDCIVIEHKNEEILRISSKNS